MRDDRTDSLLGCTPSNLERPLHYSPCHSLYENQAMVEAWQEGWEQRLRSHVKKLGYNSIYDLVSASRGESFGRMFRRIRTAAADDDRRFLTFAQLPQAYYAEAHDRGELLNAITESLARSVQQSFSQGWGKGKRIRERRIDVLTNWPAPGPGLLAGWTYRDWRRFQTNVLQRLGDSDLPADWCPADRFDERLSSAVNQVWSEVESSTEYADSRGEGVRRETM